MAVPSPSCRPAFDAAPAPSPSQQDFAIADGIFVGENAVGIENIERWFCHSVALHTLRVEDNLKTRSQMSETKRKLASISSLCISGCIR
jgi:hypothetical protein